MTPEIEALQAAIKENTQKAIETRIGSCVVEAAGKEWSYKWRNGECVLERFDEETGETRTYTFCVEVELVEAAYRTET